jgi:nucleoside-diphosphate-sugar epimerase
MKDKTALVLGATGGIGGAVARRLLGSGWTVRALKRGLDAAARHDGGIDWLRGDAMDPGAVAHAARGCAVIVHAVNPAGYRNWAGLSPMMLRHTIAAARIEGALVVLPGSVYNFGRATFPLVAHDAPQQPHTRKGRIRVAMEEELRAATADGAMRALVVRAGDYFGPDAGNNWFGQALVKPGRPLTRITVPGTPGVGHQWAYLPDVAATMVALVERRAALEPFAAFQMGGHWDADNTQMVGAIAAAVQARSGRRPATSRFPWWTLPLIAPFNETMRELREMRYLWREPVRLDNRKLVALLGAEPHTPLAQAVERTLEGLGCLDRHP